jgi:hypothetical protein
VQLNPQAVTTDVALFLAALHAAERAQTSDVQRASLQRAVALYRGELLPGYCVSFSSQTGRSTRGEEEVRLRGPALSGRSR